MIIRISCCGVFGVVEFGLYFEMTLHARGDSWWMSQSWAQTLARILQSSLALEEAKGRRIRILRISCILNHRTGTLNIKP